MHFRFIISWLIISSDQNGFNSIWLDITELIRKNIENCKKSQNKETIRYFREYTFTKTLCRFIFWLSIILSYQNGFYSTWLDIAELTPRNIENCKKILTKQRFHIFSSACLRKQSPDFSFDSRLFYPTELILTQHDSTLLNWCLKTLKTVKKFKERKASIFSRVHVYKKTLWIVLLIVDYFILPNWF